MWHYVKQAGIPFLYLLFMTMTSIGILGIEGLVWLKVLLNILSFGLYAVIVVGTSYKEGQLALKARIANDLERVQIIRTGEDRPLKLKEEYKHWKGFLTGFITCVPLIVLLIIHTILILALGEEYKGAGIIASIIYMVFFAFFRMNVSTQTDANGNAVAAEVPATIYYWTLIAIPVIMLLTGIPYILGARKIQQQQDRIKEKQRQIYGE